MIEHKIDFDIFFVAVEIARNTKIDALKMIKREEKKQLR